MQSWYIELKISTKVCDMCLNIYHNMENYCGQFGQEMYGKRKEECEQ